MEGGFVDGRMGVVHLGSVGRRKLHCLCTTKCGVVVKCTGSVIQLDLGSHLASDA